MIDVKNCKAPCSLCWDNPGRCTLSWDTPIEDIELTVRATRICREHGIATLKDLHGKIDTLSLVKGCGVNTIEELEETLDELMLIILLNQD